MIIYLWVTFEVTILPILYLRQKLSQAINTVCFINLSKLNLPKMNEFKDRANFCYLPAASKNNTHHENGPNQSKNNHLK
jgi:hypothetical protein